MDPSRARRVGRAVLIAGVSLALALAGAAPAAAGKPSVGFKNGTFDSSLAGWRLSRPAASCNLGVQTVVWTDTYAMPGGGGSAELNACGGDAHPWISQAVSLTRDASYRISGYVRYETSGYATFGVLIDGSAGTLVLDGSGGWIPFHVDFTALRSHTTISFMGEIGLDDTSWVDSVSIAALAP